MSISYSSSVSISPDVMVREVGGESVLLDLKTERYLGLDDVSTRIWQVLTSGSTIESAYQVLLDEFDVSPEKLRQDLDDFVQELQQLGLIELQTRP
jgi:Coenzyme PQQ synthesis protein D (PqqD)